MTPAEALAVMMELKPLLRAGVVTDVYGLEDGTGQLVLALPDDVGSLAVVLNLPHALPYTFPELVDLLAQTESRIRDVLTPFESDAGRGFSDTGRSTLKPGVRGVSAGDGYV